MSNICSAAGHSTGFAEGGAELTIAAMSDGCRIELGRKTLLFVRRLMNNPVTREKILARAEQIRAGAGGE